MEDLVTYERRGALALLTMDDGKANAMSPRLIAAVGAALDRAEADRAAVVLTGRPGVFSGGFDLKILKSGRFEALGMLRGGFELATRLLSFPRPVVAACSGHAIAMGVFLVLAADYRIGASGEFSLRANEVAIGMTLPRAAIEICRQRLAPAHFVRATLLAEDYSPEAAVAAGFLDRVVEPQALLGASLEAAQGLTGLDPRAHRQTKERLRRDLLRTLRRAISADMRELTLRGVRAAVERALAPAR